MSRFIWANEQIVSQESDLSKMKNLLAEVKLELESAKASEVTANDSLSLYQSYREMAESELISMRNPLDSTTSELSEVTAKLTRVVQAPNAHTILVKILGC
jgi:chromosome segregation ATPase